MKRGSLCACAGAVRPECTSWEYECLKRLPAYGNCLRTYVVWFGGGLGQESELGALEDSYRLSAGDRKEEGWCGWVVVFLQWALKIKQRGDFSIYLSLSLRKRSFKVLNEIRTASKHQRGFAWKMQRQQPTVVRALEGKKDLERVCGMFGVCFYLLVLLGDTGPHPPTTPRSPPPSLRYLALYHADLALSFLLHPTLDSYLH